MEMRICEEKEGIGGILSIHWFKLCTIIILRKYDVICTVCKLFILQSLIYT